MNPIRFPVHMIPLAALLIAAGPATDKTEKWIAIRGATIWTVTNDRIEDGIVLVKDGKIDAVGKRLEVPDGAEVIDASGGHVIPGLIDIRSDLYLSSTERTESTKIAAHFDITNGLDFFDKASEQVLEEGVTSVYVGPGHRGLIGGLGAVVRVGTPPDPKEAVLKRAAALKLSLGVADSQRTSAEWRLGHYHDLRSAFLSAKRYRESWEKYREDLAEYKKKKAEFDKEKEKEKKKKKKKEGEEKAEPKDAKKDKSKKKPEAPKEPRKPRKDPSKEVLLEAMDGKVPVRIETERSDSIRNAIRLAKEFDLDWALEGGAEAAAVASDLAEADVPVIIGPIVISSLQGVDAIRWRSEMAGELAQAGVRVAIGTGGGGGLPSRYLRYQACLAVRHGMDREAALRSITIVPAEILGVSKRIGSIEEGKDADLVILDGDPLSSLSRVTHVIRGNRVVRAKSPPHPSREF